MILRDVHSTTTMLRRHKDLRGRRSRLAAAAALMIVAWASAASAQGGDAHFTPGNLLLSRSVYDNKAATVQAGVTMLPPGCVTGCVAAVNDGTYPFVWNNDGVDASFGITSKIFLDHLTTSGVFLATLEVPNGARHGESSEKEGMVTSFSSKSEIALNLSTDGNYVTFMGYAAPLDALDVSNSNTPLISDPTNPVTGATYRVVAQVDQHGQFRFTRTNAYSGNNGRAAILNNSNGANFVYTAGNAGNGGDPQPNGILIAGGAQILRGAHDDDDDRAPGNPTPVGSFNITQLGATHDKLGKDNNFRGLTIFDDVVYFTKGSGGNGVNTVYFIDTSGQACPNGIGLPQAGAKLPTMALPYDPALLPSDGLQPNNMCILKGFPSTLNSALKKKTTRYPFGLWFADANTVYVADEGDGALADAGATPAGLQKWVFDPVAMQWNLVYTLQTGLGLGATYHFPGDVLYPSGINAATGLPWAPVTDGLRNITGRVNSDGTATIWGITSTVSGNGDQGADPNQLVVITDVIANVSPAVALTEGFMTLRTAGFGEVLRGVSFTPGTMVRRCGNDGNDHGSDSDSAKQASRSNDCDR